MRRIVSLLLLLHINGLVYVRLKMFDVFGIFRLPIFARLVESVRSYLSLLFLLLGLVSTKTEEVVVFSGQLIDKAVKILVALGRHHATVRSRMFRLVLMQLLLHTLFYYKNLIKIS